MNPFTQWLADMRSAGLAKSDAECARLLGITPRGLLYLKRGEKPVSTMHLLAMAAVLRRLNPYEAPR